MNPPPQTLSPVELAKTISDLPTVDLVTFQDALLTEMIRKTPGVCGGDACVRNTRIPIWLLISFSQQGLNQTDLLRNYPGLTAFDLSMVQLYHSLHRQEIDDLIALENAEDDEDGLEGKRFQIFINDGETSTRKRRQCGSAKGQVWISDDFNEPLE
jgi:uncharacterized protein (DUF433 family)